MEGFIDVKALSELICPKDDEELQNFDDEQKIKPYSKKSDVKRKIVKEEKAKSVATKVKNDQKLEFEDYLEKSEEPDWRKTPEWCVAYKQKVTPSDMFLQMSGKTPSTSSCEEMIITINLPGEQSKSIDVKVTENHLDMTSSMYKLSVPLPHPVDPRKGNEAKWYSDEEQLKLILIMEREFDFMNF